MKKLSALVVSSLAALAAVTGQASAWCHDCCNQCCATICLRQYNAFTPVCCGSLSCTGCCPVTFSGFGNAPPPGPAWGGMPPYGPPAYGYGAPPAMVAAPHADGAPGPVLAPTQPAGPNPPAVLPNSPAPTFRAPMPSPNESAPATAPATPPSARALPYPPYGQFQAVGYYPGYYYGYAPAGYAMPGYWAAPQQAGR
jgi:hypothetical protein